MLYKIFKYIAIAFGVVTLYFIVRIWVVGDDALETSGDLQAALVTPFIYVGYIALILAAAVALIFAIKDLFKGNIKNTLIVTGAFVAIVLIGYLLAEGRPIEANGTTYSANTVRWIGAGLYVFYILGILAILSMMMTGFKKLKNR